MTRVHAPHRLIPALFALLASAACDSPSALNLADGDHLLRTEASAYTLVRTGEALQVKIPYTFDNRTGGDVYLVNCNQYVPPLLERKVDGRWRSEWGPVENDCLSPPVIVRGGGVYVDTLWIYAAPYGGSFYPQFPSAEISGIYRLRWNRALSSFQTNRYPFGEEIPLKHRVSNAFELREP